MGVKKLPAEAMCKLQSGIIITDAVQCVLELVRNSLDAEATGIVVRVDLKNYQIRVIDNGKGIDKDDLVFVGERFMTSKYNSSADMENSPPTYGFRGQALSSLQDVSKCLTIETKSVEGGPTFVKVFQNKRVLPIKQSDYDRSGIGTTVIIDDFMCTMPVRRKRIREVFDMEEIKTQLQYLAIIHYGVCFTLRNENKALTLLQTAQASNILESITSIYGQTIAKSLMSLSCEEKKYELSGFISLKPQAQNNIQLLYVNKRIVSKGVVHKFVNSLIKEYRGKKSLFGDSPTNLVLKKMKSSFNVFIFLIKCPHTYYELFTNGRKVTVEFKNWKDALKCVHRAVKRVFKDVSNLDSSSNTQEHNKNKGDREVVDSRRVFGTSVLVNAVKGVPVKRCFKNKVVRNGKKIKMADNKEESAVLSTFTKNANGSWKSTDDLNKTLYASEFSNDSLESPIPKKTVKKFKPKSDSDSKKTVISQSFIEFYEWLKVKFETNAHIFDLYNDFLEFKNRVAQSPDIPQFRSPVLGGKLKRKQAPNFKYKGKKQKIPANDLSGLNEEMEVATQKELKILTNQQIQLRKAVQFTTDSRAHTHETLNLGCIRSESVNFDKRSNQLFKKPEIASGCRNERPVECNHKLHSLPSSEVQFTNIITFRNCSDSFFHPSPDFQDVNEKTFTASNTWVSHYQDLVSENAEFCKGKYCKVQNLAPWMDDNEIITYGKYKELQSSDSFKSCERPLNIFDNKARKAIARDAVQVNMSGLPAQRVNAIVQTFNEVPETPSFESSYLNSQRIAVEDAKASYDNGYQKEPLKDHLSKDLPHPDFWNSSTHLVFEQYNNQQEYISNGDEMTSDKTNNDNSNKKNLTSNEFVCGHKSQSSTKAESTSKETQTLAIIWADSLREMGYSVGNINTNNANQWKSQNTQLSQSNIIPKTIPIEEIQGHAVEQIQSEFCVTERHDFVPKGLSPKFLNTETAKVTPLSPNEKCKIKLTLEDIQNDFLATIKWQNESIDDFIKPTIPDEIIFEISRKAGEKVMNCENPVLSAALPYCAVKVHNLLHSFAFTKDLLSDAEVLGQLDKKFIVTKMKISTTKKMELISLFDQHAVDERIKLEELINDNMSPEGEFVSGHLDPPVECTLTEFDVGVISNLKEKLLNIGLSAMEINGNTLSINEIPIFLLKKHENDLKNGRESSLSEVVKALVLNVIEEVKETRGAVSKIPKIIHNAFCLEACHKAIKFNKSLSIENMMEMIRKLQSCKLPFQCAHGRPSIIPIIDLEDFRSMMEENEILDLQKLKKFLNGRKQDSGI